MKQVEENRRFFPANNDCSSALPDCWRISDRKE